uniref:Uncharacterized protein n=1 Tax=Rhizophagus irregularis (strain DAOM 181602 / DAOM 197198 / MUCL 43194) TaxID=747089 RepID=U9U4J8_RHIID
MYDRVPMKFQARPTALRVLIYELTKVIRLIILFASDKSFRNSLEFSRSAYSIIVAYGLIAITADLFYGIAGFNIFNSIMIIAETITSAIECLKLDNLNEIRIIHIYAKIN